MTIKIKNLVFWVFFLSFIAFVQTIHAQEKSNFATAEDVAIAFYKTANIVPDFKDWIKKQQPYSTTALARRPKIMEQELIRLKGLYSQYDPLTDILRIKTSSLILPFKTNNDSGQEVYGVSVILDPDKAIEYFPYEYLDRNIMLVPNKFKSMKAHSISKFEYERIKKMVKPKMRYPLMLNFLAKKADIDFPYEVDGIAQWAFSVDIASIESWTNEGRLIWEYSAPWYLSKNEMRIKNLYQENPEESSLSGYVKPLNNIK